MKNVVFVTDGGSKKVFVFPKIDFQARIYSTGNFKAALSSTHFRIDCAAHLINNIVRCMLDSNPQSMGFTVVDSCRRIVASIRRSTIHSKLTKTLKSDTKTRWYSTFQMLDSVLSFWDELQELIPTTMNEYEIDKSTLSSLREFLEPFKNATKDLQQSNKCTIHLVILWRMKLLSHMQINLNDSSFVKEMKKSGLEYLETKWTITDLHRKSIFFHPQLKTLRVLNETERKSILQSIRAEANQIESTNEECFYGPIMVLNVPKRSEKH